jgi:hypothetical protein
MIIRALDINSDWTFGKGKQNYLTETNAIKLNISTRLKQWKGDCFYATTEGVDYNNFLSYGTKNFLDRDIKRVILQTEGILKIKTYTSTLDRTTRKINIETTLISIYDEVIEFTEVV